MRLRACWRLLRVVWHILVGLGTIVLVFPRLSPDKRHARIQAWALEMLACIAITLVVKGSPPAIGPMLLVANHISWLDIVVVHAARHCRFVSKDEVGRWPLVATLANAAGTLYITRESRRDAMRLVHQMAQCLGDGDVLGIFRKALRATAAPCCPFTATCCKRPSWPMHRCNPWRCSLWMVPAVRSALRPAMWATIPCCSHSGAPCARTTCRRLCSSVHRSWPRAATAALGQAICAPPLLICAVSLRA